ncbi:hypothetical protein TPHA_0A05570 [Tetrapisispora phaffii CBS 4417]|uniref:Pre-mRNA-splicing factor CWC22 n=1 Tax=Tetrapisispora phaffii (strain ATCC 24235 / CBS 4417 / NBRC 1672 / NRRL Y-8282 / UCD 70-5) TaxID=1071381 RepID=G8BP03_TETPH|nr:hypothetical protein TPHA_0A05570 [Tetrapisispora phaffii CBS 4417]CCE61631.1 hypothetical protein TPHA_0A05570 [Tetrapisispora phaffii CBS 4417]
MEESTVNDEQLQKENWQMMQAHVEDVLDNISSTTIVDIFLQLLSVNLPLSRYLIVSVILNRQIVEDKAVEYSALIALVNSEFPEIGESLIKESVAWFIKGYNTYDNRYTYSMISLISQLFNYDVLHEIAILQILHLLMDDIENGSIDIIIRVMELTGEKLSTVCKTVHNMVFEKLREILQQNIKSSNISRYSLNAIESLFELRARQYRPNIFRLIDIPPHDSNMHTFMIDVNNIEPSKELTKFIYQKDFDDNNKKYDEIKQTILKKYEPSDSIGTKEVKIEDRTGTDDVEFKKKIYLLLKSSLSGDEAAHKILKQRIPDVEKQDVVDVIFKTSIQETTYSKFYGILVERLLNSHKIWKSAFLKIWESHYEKADDFEPNQLRIVGKLWGHIFASDYIGFEAFSIIHMNEDETTPAGRILVKYIFQKLVSDLGIDELKSRLNEEYIQPYQVNIFPVDDPEKSRYSINYFTAIGLGVLTENMRKYIELINEKKREEKEKEDEEKEKVYQEIRKKRIEAAIKQRKQNITTDSKQTPRDTETNKSRVSRYDRGSGVSKPDRSKTPPRRTR